GGTHDARGFSTAATCNQCDRERHEQGGIAKHFHEAPLHDARGVFATLRGRRGGGGCGIQHALFHGWDIGRDCASLPTAVANAEVGSERWIDERVGFLALRPGRASNVRRAATTNAGAATTEKESDGSVAQTSPRPSPRCSDPRTGS